MRRKEGREGQRVEKRRSSVRAGSRARFSVGLYSREANTQSGDYKNSPLEARCLLFATLLLVASSLPFKKVCWQSRGAGDRDFFRTKIKFLGSLGRVRITNLANDIQCCTGKLIYHADQCLPISHCAQMIQQKVSSRIKRAHKIFQAPGKQVCFE